MDTPNIINKLIDHQDGVTYKVIAYRKLTEKELIFAVRHHLANRKGKPKKGTIVTIYSIIGHNG